jgi:hypothetical protein
MTAKIVSLAYHMDVNQKKLDKMDDGQEEMKTSQEI